MKIAQRENENSFAVSVKVFGPRFFPVTIKFHLCFLFSFYFSYYFDLSVLVPVNGINVAADIRKGDRIKLFAPPAIILTAYVDILD